MARYLNTVLGSITTDAMGATLVHEHVNWGFAGWQADRTVAPFDEKASLKKAVEVLTAVRESGVKTYIDATPNDSGRDVRFLREVARASGINIICSTGLYNEGHGGSAYFKFRGVLPFANAMEELQELFSRELTDGIEDTSIKAGVIKVATGDGGSISSYEERVLKAAARVSKETGVPVITHTHGGNLALEQADLLISEGASPSQIVIGHMGGISDIDYHLAVLARGVYIGFDRFGADMPPEKPDSENITCIMELIQRGYAQKILLSHDFTINMLGRQVSQLLARLPNWYPTHLFKNILPALKVKGVSNRQIDEMTVENPKRLFEGG
jgi:phosphotriesterase-related protein